MDLKIEVLKASVAGLLVFADQLQKIIDAYDPECDPGEEWEPEELRQEPEPHYLEALWSRGEINTRLYNAVRRGYCVKHNELITTLEQLSGVTRKEVIRYQNLGKDTIKHLNCVMDQYGVHFLGEE